MSAGIRHTTQTNELGGAKISAAQWDEDHEIANPPTGWETPTGTMSRAAFDPASVTLVQLAQRVAALISDSLSAGYIKASGVSPANSVVGHSADSPAVTNPGATVITAPVISLANAANAYPPQISALIDDTAIVGDTLRLQWDDNVNFTTPVEATNAIDDAEALANAAAMAGLNAIAAPDQTFFRLRIERGITVSAWSNIIKHGDVTAPGITSSNAVSNTETLVLAHALTADELIASWAIVGGADASMFEISGSTLRWVGNSTRDYENPEDADFTNTYVVDIRATDLAGNPSAIQTITVTVSNGDELPNAFTFTDVSGATAATQYTSNTITVAGLGSGIAVPVTIDGGGGQYSKNGGAYTAAPTTAVNGDQFAVRVTSGAAGEIVNTTLTVGEGSDTYSVTTFTAQDAAYLAYQQYDLPFDNPVFAISNVPFLTGVDIVCVRKDTGGRTITGVTTGGVACTLLATSGNMSIWGRVASAGTRNVAVTFDFAMGLGCVICASVTGVDDITLEDTALLAEASAADPHTFASQLDVPSPGVGIAFAFAGNSSGLTWAAGTELTDQSYNTSQRVGLAKFFASTTPSYLSGSHDLNAGVAIAFGP